MAYIIGLALLIFWPLWSDPWGPMSWVSSAFCFYLHNITTTLFLILDLDRGCFRGLLDLCYSHFRFRVSFYICPERRSPKDGMMLVESI